jgi:aerobic C4-dicarboxylate transport protein
MDSMRVSVNLLGNCVATFVVAKWEGQFDREAMLRAFRGELPEGDSEGGLPEEVPASDITDSESTTAGITTAGGAPEVPAAAAGVR